MNVVHELGCQCMGRVTDKPVMWSTGLPIWHVFIVDGVIFSRILNT